MFLAWRAFGFERAHQPAVGKPGERVAALRALDVLEEDHLPARAAGEELHAGSLERANLCTMPGDEKIEKTAEAVPTATPELPVVARMVVEIRSDGARTMARGAVEDLRTGEKTELKVEGASPLLLVASLLNSLRSVPSLVRDAAWKLLPKKR